MAKLGDTVRVKRPTPYPLNYDPRGPIELPEILPELIVLDTQEKVDDWNKKHGETKGF